MREVILRPLKADGMFLAASTLAGKRPNEVEYSHPQEANLPYELNVSDHVGCCWHHANVGCFACVSINHNCIHINSESSLPTTKFAVCGAFAILLHDSMLQLLSRMSVKSVAGPSLPAMPTMPPHPTLT